MIVGGSRQLLTRVREGMFSLVDPLLGGLTLSSTVHVTERTGEGGLNLLAIDFPHRRHRLFCGLENQIIENKRLDFQGYGRKVVPARNAMAFRPRIVRDFLLQNNNLTLGTEVAFAGKSQLHLLLILTLSEGVRSAKLRAAQREENVPF